MVGMDKFGNRYWENNKYTYPRNRWVDYNRAKFLDYDASQIPPEWLEVETYHIILVFYISFYALFSSNTRIEQILRFSTSILVVCIAINKRKHDLGGRR